MNRRMGDCHCICVTTGFCGGGGCEGRLLGQGGVIVVSTLVPFKKCRIIKIDFYIYRSDLCIGRYSKSSFISTSSTNNKSLGQKFYLFSL